MFSSNTSQQSEGYQIQRSLRFNSADSAYLNRAPSSAGNRQIFTLSCWVKRSALGAYSSLLTVGGSDVMWFTPSDAIEIASAGGALLTTAVYRDVSAWYHVVIAFDTPQATASNRIKLYVNGVQVTAFGTATYPAQNANSAFNSTSQHFIGAFPGTLYHFPGYMTEVNFIDGQALTPSSFGQTNANTGVWEPKPYAGTYGTNGFYLNFSDNSNTTATTLGKDYSGNGNNWTPNNFSVAAGAGNDSLVDVPTAWGTDTGVGGTVRGNYATFNPLYILGGSASTFSNGNLEVNTTGRKIRSTFAIPENSKIYAEFVATSIPNFTWIGVVNDNGDEQLIASGNFGFNDYAANDVIGIAVDTSANTAVFYKNGTLFTTKTTVAGATYFFACYGQAATTFIANFGQRPFAYTAPSGFKALCTQNLPTPTIGATASTQAGKFFNPVLYTGNGSARSITGVGFQPDFTWIKERSSTSGNTVTDVVRGTSKNLVTEITAAEGTSTNVITSFDADGFSLGTDNSINENNQTYVAWNWKANGAGVTNTAGSITSTVSANTTSGFSVVTYTGNGTGGATVGHGLGAAPAMMIIKRRSTAAAWVVYHASLGATQGIYLNLTDSAYTGSTFWNNTSPGSSVFTIGTVSENNVNGSTYVAYCFAEVPGFSKFGSYTGNGSTDGPFVYCGFRPAYVMIKSTVTIGDNSTCHWVIKDKLRAAQYNPQDGNLYSDLSAAEDTTSTVYIDFLSNGFKIRGNYAGINNNGSTYIFAAFAEFPQKFSLAR